ncbi:Dual specificity mitogen-activated protein kinase kinase 5 [Collichthys lucidus]|uniref:Dual specificity mitogen-activated protein kinase kinase 5 n=1 Tax=Collichthys lucidus TaxID=240159 RepID=A0A4U5U629_COLLU|nr:Dual specificity mitogen-activated protein kinase kinase 5 [Collichthys lucidus]
MLDLINIFVMDAEAIVIRIKTPLGDMDSSVDCPSLLNFNDLLVAIRDVMPEATVTAFEYEDEVGDRITVRSDEELKAMLSYSANDDETHSPLSLSHLSLKAERWAYHLIGNRVLAVKVIPLDITVELQKQIMSELEILYKCDSPYIITFFSAFFVENRISICTEFMDGGSLDVYKRIPEHVLGRIAVALVNSIAKTYVGTNAYMAPERISGEQYGIHADVWSVGISFMEPLQLLQCIVDEDPPVLPVGQFSEKFVHFITQCMRRQPKERPAPNNLMDHSFIIQFNDGNAEVVSMWVCRCLEERRSQQAQGHV